MAARWPPVLAGRSEAAATTTARPVSDQAAGSIRGGTFTASKLSHAAAANVALAIQARRALDRTVTSMVSPARPALAASILGDATGLVSRATSVPTAMAPAATGSHHSQNRSLAWSGLTTAAAPATIA